MSPEKEAELFATLGGMCNMLQNLHNTLQAQGNLLQIQGERIARIEGILANTPQTAEFYELRGRVEEISRRLPNTLAYAPPRAS
ncbi:MAG: hypothetical protein WCF85_12550 [Rhodospirillaceae bacterium]